MGAVAPETALCATMSVTEDGLELPRDAAPAVGAATGVVGTALGAVHKPSRRRFRGLDGGETTDNRNRAEVVWDR